MNTPQHPSISLISKRINPRAMLMAGALMFAAMFGMAPQANAGEFFERNGVAIDGFDPVAYFTEKKPTKGNQSFSSQYKESTFHFSNAANRDMFAANPEKFAPQYDGFCAYGVSQGAKVKIEGDLWAVVDGKLYLNYDEGVQATWVKDIPGYIKTADKKWPDVK